MRYRISAVTDIGMIRRDNQDNFFCNGYYVRETGKKTDSFDITIPDEEQIILAVFDGMGGLEKGEVAARIACESVNRLAWMGNESIESAVKSANRALCVIGRERNERMGSTCVFLEKNRGSFRSLNIGDSRAYWITGNTMIQILYDHNETNSRKQLAKSTDMVCGTEYNKNSLTQHLGVLEEEFLLEPYVSEWIRPSIGDMFLLCSDGLNEMLSDDELRDELLANVAIPVKCSRLIEKAKQRGGFDNITAVLMGIEEV